MSMTVKRHSAYGLGDALDTNLSWLLSGLGQLGQAQHEAPTRPVAPYRRRYEPQVHTGSGVYLVWCLSSGCVPSAM